ncbi:NAD(P)-dependent oxidoreductase [Kitasatospora cheerisanensis]|uniref:Putative oxidoreductase n=1 Tax=Kitasatospora cheerisanensis KCTC 2395 TaxID=1348663 RepID=A0A066ZAZ4_9ACTN|nr:NAD(P)-dependent oxidoreductase [Kitasatospora cheerisanensis]KDN87305.1 putative oxidoreductase [Kitasatospora cheerisanensis KCTC 2395]
MNGRVLLLDAAPGELLGRELDRLLGHGLDLTLNLRRVADPAAARAAWAGRLSFTDFDPFDESGLRDAVRDGGRGFDALKSRAGVPLRAGFLTAATDRALARPLRVIGRAGAGTDHVDLAAAARLGVTVTHTPGSNAVAVAEFALGQILALTRRLVDLNAAAHQGRWTSPPPARGLSELTLGVAGLGRIGRALAVRASTLGMRVLGWSRNPVRIEGVEQLGSLEQLLAASDVLSLHLPLTADTHGLLGPTELALLRPGALLVNTARGGLVDEHALAAALRDPAHPLAGAAVDTFEHEHAAFASPLCGLPNALLTPHVAGMTHAAMEQAALRCADHLAALLAGHPDGVPVARP